MSADHVVGISLDGVTATAVWRTRATGPWQVVAVPCDGTPRGVVQAFAVIATQLENVVFVHVSLMRPLADARVLDFPPMARSTLEAVLERDWARHVIGLWATPHTASVRRMQSGQWRSAFAPTETLEAIAHAAVAHGWRDVTVCTGDDAIAAATTAERDDPPGAPRVAMVCDGDGPTDCVLLRGGDPVAGRRFLRPTSDADVAACVRESMGDHARGATVVVIGSPSRSGDVVRALAQAGHRARAMDIGLANDASAGAIMAVVGALGAPVLELRAPAARAALGRRHSRVTAWLLGAAALALVIAFVIERTALRVAVTSVRAARADIAAPVQRAMVTRSDVLNAIDLASTLAQREANASRTAVVMAAIATALPPGTALTTLSVSGDSVTIEGEGARTAAVYGALRALPEVEQVRLASPLRQERLSGDAAIERFSFSARVHRVPATGGVTR